MNDLQIKEQRLNPDGPPNTRLPVRPCHTAMVCILRSFYALCYPAY